MTSQNSPQETFYFGAGPAKLPNEVLTIIQNEVLDYRSTGLSVLELSHRSDPFIEIINQAEELLRELWLVPDEYAVLFQHGGATAHYSMLPINFLHKQDHADYICSGHWSTKACEEGKKFAEINEVQVLDQREQTCIQPVEQWRLTDDASYLHYCDNETISGVAFNEELSLANKRIFCDMTSSILTKPIQIRNYDLIYASAQKNLGVAGLCVTIIKKSLLERVKENIPSVFDYKRCYEEKSLVNTPPTFAIYALGLMMKWLKLQGGVEPISQSRAAHAKTIYKLIDSSSVYENSVSTNNRSLVNISFSIKSESKKEEFLQQAENQGLLGLRGHKSVGGVRISLYNAMPAHGMQKLITFMQAFDS